jgi:chemotaxis response regulator CheB
LFCSAALTFGKCTLGIDGTQGAAHIEAVGGEVIVQDPKSATAPSMPKSIILSGLSTDVVKLDEINSKIPAQVSQLMSNLKA